MVWELVAHTWATNSQTIYLPLSLSNSRCSFSRASPARQAVSAGRERVLTTFAIMQGSDFWFNLLGRIAQARTAITKNSDTDSGANQGSGAG